MPCGMQNLISTPSTSSSWAYLEKSGLGGSNCTHMWLIYLIIGFNRMTRHGPRESKQWVLDSKKNSQKLPQLFVVVESEIFNQSQSDTCYWWCLVINKNLSNVIEWKLQRIFKNQFHIDTLVDILHIQCNQTLQCVTKN